MDVCVGEGGGTYMYMYFHLLEENLNFDLKSDVTSGGQ